MNTIYKYPIPDVDFGAHFAIEMESCATIVHFSPDPQGILCVWAQVFPGADKVRRLFTIHPTGGKISSKERYVATHVGSKLVLHLHEVNR